MNILELINDFKRHNSMLWLENDTIRLFVSDDFKSASLKETIVRNKPEILAFLALNQIHSKDDFIKRRIFKSGHHEGVLSFAQERLWFLEQFEEGTNAYHMPDLYELDKETDPAGIKYALQSIVARHEVFRSTIVQNDGDEHAIQVVHDAPLEIAEQTLNGQSDYQAVLHADINKPFDLSKEYPIRVKFYTIISPENTSKTILLVTRHHIATDGWSVGIFHKELMAFYEAFTKGNHGFSLPALGVQYKDFAAWQKNHLTGTVLEKQLNHWKEKLAGYQPLELPVDFARPSEKDYRGASQVFSLNKELSGQLRVLARNLGVTLHSVLLSSINIFLSKYSGQNDIVTGSPIANRQYRQTEGLIGFFVNMQANRSRLSNSQSFATLVEQTHEEQVKGQMYQDLPFEKLVDELGVPRDNSRHPVFQVMFEVQGRLSVEQSKDEERRILIPFSLEEPFEVARFDLSILFNDGQEELKGMFGFATSLFRPDTIERFIHSYTHLLTQLAASPEKPYSEHSILSAEERDKILYQWNDTGLDCPQDKTICELFHDQVEATPDKVALVFEQKELTYRELDEKSNQLARHLRSQYQERTRQELVPDTLIGIFLDRSLEMVIGILGVLKAGASYVPLDPNHPQRRIDYILEDSNIELILSQRHLVEGNDIQLPQEKVVFINLTEALYLEEEVNKMPFFNSVADLAYVIYTSGTTGKPKGAMLPHSSIVTHAYAMLNVYDAQIEVLATLSAFAVDSGNTAIYTALLSGKKLVVVPERIHLDSRLLGEYISDKQVDCYKIVPNLLEQLIDSGQAESLLPKATIIVGGAALSWGLVEKINRLDPKVRILNHYGPTEAAIGATVHYVGTSEESNTPLIGKPLANYSAYVLGADGQPVPVGGTGELHLGGGGLARGYLNRPELSEERFIPDPFATENDKAKGHTKLYKTGDLVRLMTDGSIEYLGRNDDQVKIRGYRIELGEIEEALSQVVGIRNSAVIVKERPTASSTTKYLVAYYIPEESDTPVNQTSIHAQLSKALPEYMVPGAFVELETFPLDVNGKLNRSALPDPDLRIAEDEYVAPSTELEKVLGSIWEDVLGLDQVSMTDDFFRIGGDSILSIQVSGRIRLAGYNCQVKDIFECKTIARLAVQLSKESSALHIRSEQGQLTGAFDFLPIQQWFFEKAENGEIAYPNYWNQSFLVKVPELDAGRLEAILPDLVAYHDALRLQFVKDQSPEGWKQVYQEKIDIPVLNQLDTTKHSASEIHEILTGWQNDFDLSNGPLFRIGYLTGYEDGTARIFVALHHLIVDGVSWRILIEDVKSLYEGKALARKGTSYRQWVETVGNYASQNTTEAAYWEQQLKGITGFPEFTWQDTASSAQVELDSATTKLLLQKAPEAYHTEINDLLLTALAFALKDINHQDIQGISLEGHGREAIDIAVDTSRTVGWFTTLYPVRLELQSDLETSIQFIKESLRKIPNKGIGFGAFAQDDATHYSHKDLFPISFNYLGQFDSREGNWQVVAESSGRSMHPSNSNQKIISFDGGVSEGKLIFGVETKLGEEITQRLSERFQAHLSQIVAHCIARIEQTGGGYTPSDFATVNISQGLLDRLQSSARESGNEIAQIYPANSLQQGFVYHALSKTTDDAYRLQLLYDIPHKLDVANYIKAWEHCIAQYPILRTAFNWEEDLIQVIHKQGKLEYELHNLSHLPTQEQRDVAIKSIQVADRKNGFDLAQPTLMRLHIIKQTEDSYTILKSEHHSISDGWSLPILITNLHQYYQALSAGNQVQIQEDTAYFDALEYISSQKSSIHEYWDQTLSTVESVNDINPLLSEPIDFRDYNKVEQPTTNSIEIEADLYHAIKAFSLREGLTINVIVQFVWHKLLQVYSSNPQSIVGTTVSGRDLPVEGIEKSVGLYINTLPLLVNWENDETMLAQLHQIQERITALGTHSFADLAKLKKDGERLFHSILVYENYPTPKEGGDGPNISIRSAIQKNEYPLALMASEQSDALNMVLQYDQKHLTEAKAKEHLAMLKSILEQVIESPNESHSRISLLSPERYDQIIYQWNENDQPNQNEKTVDQAFEEQVVKTPDSTALSWKGQTLSYRQLNEKSNQLARYIRTEYQNRTGQSLQNDNSIALCLDRSLEMVIAILAVLKAGGAYVPIDPDYPRERIDYILEDTAAKLILTQRSTAEESRAQLPLEKVIYIDLAEEIYETEDSSNLGLNTKSDAMAYVIYTSGTTGKPKGVMVEHQQVVSFAMENNFLDEERVSVVGGLSNYAFDGSIFDLFFSLLNGKKLVLLGKDQVSDLAVLDKQLIEYKVDTVFITTALFNSLAENRSNCLESLQQILFGGEICNKSMVNSFKDRYPSTTLIHVYGPTENIVYSSYCNLREADTNQVVPIGKPLSDKKLYVLDANRNPVPVNVVGELYIGGSGVARGYLNRPDLTEERFVPNPFASAADQALGNTRLYKTGDLVKWLPGGNIDFIGRNDDQVKIRGHRIELGEIEQALMEIKGIEQSCVLAKERQAEFSSKYLVAYYVPGKDGDAAAEADPFAHVLPDYMRPAPTATKITEEKIREELSRMLPDYMQPTVLIELDSFPLNSNGKIDKRALPDPELSASPDDYVAPTNELEEGICKVWTEVLGIDRVGITDDFYSIGGDSISSIRIVSKIGALGLNASVSDLLMYRTIQDFVQNAGRGTAKNEIDYVPFSLIDPEAKSTVLDENCLQIEEIEDIYPAGYLQSGMLIESFAKSNNGAYYDVLSYIINAEFDQPKFESIWGELVTKNEQLRTAFVPGEEGYLNTIHKTIAIDSKISLLNQDEDLEQLVRRESLSGYDLASPGLFRLFIQPDQNRGEFTFVLSIHHAIADGWSMALFMAEFVDAYVHGKAIDQTPLPPYAKVIYQEQESLNNNTDKQFWLDYLAAYDLKSGSLILNGESNPAQEDIRIYQTLSQELSGKVIDLAKELKMSPDVIFLGAYNLVLSLFYNTNDFVIGTVTNNRLEEEGGDKVFGLHLNTIPIRFQTKKDTSARDYFSALLKDKLRINKRKMYPYGKVKSDLGLREDIYKCAFNYVHFHVAEKNYNDESFDTGHSSSKSNIPLVLNVRRYQNSFGFKLEGHHDFLDQQTGERFVAYLQSCLDQLLQNPEKLIQEYQPLLPAEYDEIIHQWNNTEKPFPHGKTFFQLFQEQVDRTPDNIALEFAGQSLSYQQLDEKSNQLARHLRTEYQMRTGQTLSPDTLIALYLDRSLELVVGILAVMKAGGAYVPIDTSYPQERIVYILDDTQSQLILCKTKSDLNHLPQDKLVDITLTESLYRETDTGVLPPYSQADDLAYVIYTSGTAGQPKGVMVEHRAYAQFIYNFHDYLSDHLEHDQRDLLSLTNYVFDIFGLEYGLPLIRGSKVILSSIEKVTASELSACHIVQQTPSSLLHIATNYSAELSEKVCLVGGEALLPPVAEKLTGAFKKVFNVYGPAETVIWSTVSEVLNPNQPHIGKPLFNEQVYVLHPNNSPVPQGVIGELYIGGSGLARGYLNRPELTEERFIPNSFATTEDRAKGYTRLYKTGDLVRWLPDGNLEYIARNDDQIKIHGHRIELGEIESALAQIPEIMQSCVLAREKQIGIESHKYLVGYYVLNTPNKLTQSAIVEELARLLPEYMLPGILVELESFPLTVNGKLDKRALPDPDLSLANEYVEPGTEKEAQLCDLWKEVLGLERVGITDDFFRIGGSSMLALQVTHRMSKLLETEVRVADVFRFKSIESLLANLQVTGDGQVDLVNPYQDDYHADLEDMIMIHPATAGSEVFQPLADLLSGRYNCIGIDNHNIHSSEKIGDMNELATHYLREYESKYALKQAVNLLGWSLGGQIALEMAVILESRGYQNVNVILLDSFIKDEAILRFDDRIGEEDSKKDLRNELKRRNYTADYIELVLSGWAAERALGRAQLSGHLHHSKVTLFKALLKEPEGNLPEDALIRIEHYKSLKTNNIDLVADHVRIIPLDCNHMTILDTHGQAISDHLLSEHIEIQEV